MVLLRVQNTGMGLFDEGVPLGGTRHVKAGADVSIHGRATRREAGRDYARVFYYTGTGNWNFGD